LYKLGFGAELNYDTYGADSSYGSSTTRAVEAFFIRNELPMNGEIATLKVAQMIIQHYDSLEQDPEKAHGHSAAAPGDLTIRKTLPRKSHESNGFV